MPTKSTARSTREAAGHARAAAATTSGFRQRWGAAAALLALVFLAYAPAMRAGFLWDDVTIYLLENPIVKAADGLYRFWFTKQATDYYPLTNTLFWIEWRLFGTHAAGYHVAGILLHGVTVVLLWRVLLQFAVPGAWVAAALFAVHPVCVESVAWISQSKTTLSMLLFFAALLVWLRSDAARARGPNAAASRRGAASAGRAGLWVALGLYVLALLAKTSAATLPLVLLGSTWWRRQRITARDVVRVAPFVVTGALLGAVSIAFQLRAPGAVAALAEPFTTRLVAAGWIVWFYLYKALLPIHLTLVYPYWTVNPRDPIAYLPGLALIGVFVLVWRMRHSWGRPLMAGLGYFVVNLLPVLGFVGIGFMSTARVTDHWQYAGLPGVVALIVGIIAHRFAPHGSKPRPIIALAASAVLLGVVLTARQASLYLDEETVWRDNVRKNPRAWEAQNYLGTALAKQGRFAEAEVHLAEAVRLMPDYDDALINLGNVLDELGRVQEALKVYAHALEVSQPDPLLYYNVALIFEKMGRLPDAAEQYTQSLRLQPDDPDVHLRLAEILARQGSARDAVEHYREVLRLRPSDVPTAGKLAWLLATCGDPQVQDGAEAVRLATQVCEATGNADPAALDILAAAYASSGRFDAAADAARRALLQVTAERDTALARQIWLHLERYESSRDR